jgi:putative CocE/NonD family hydrolase
MGERRAVWAGIGLIAWTGAAPCAGQGLAYVKAHYTKSEHQVKMRDGAKLFTVVYVPKDASARKTYPILLSRTPYGVSPYGSDNYKPALGPSEAACREGFIFAYQDVRGRHMSEGVFVDVRPHVPVKASAREIDESTDGYDTIEWLLGKVRHHNGRVGVWGISYPGFYAAMATIDAHPALVAASPQAPIADWFIGDDFHHNGAFFLPHAFNFYAVFGRPRPKPAKEHGPPFDPGTGDGYRFFHDLGPLPNADRKHFKGEVAFWNEMMAHETYDDFWKARNLRPHLKRIKPAVLTVGGWFDAEDLFGALEVYKNIEKANPGVSNRLVMGPWYHGGWARSDGEKLGRIHFDAPTSRFYREEIELKFWKALLKDGKDPGLAEATVFETGRNQWRSLEAWPPRTAKPLAFYLAGAGALSSEPPPDEGYDEYVSDPRRPVPFTEDVSIGMTREYMTDDQRFAARRPDVLAYESEVLEEDLTAAGPIEVKLVVSTTGTDSDFVVKLIDVYPADAPDPNDKGDEAGGPDPKKGPVYTRMGGYQQLVRGEPMRGKFRRSFEAPEPFEPSVPASVEFVMPDVFHTFKRGHRVMVQVQSTWFPLVNLNPQKFTNIHTATEADFQKATQRVYRGKGRASAVVLPVLPQEP